MKYNILVTEDNKDIQNIIKLYLESNNYNVLCASDGDEALKIVKNTKIDLGILDIMIPKIDGYELTKKIRQNMNIPIILVTAKNQDTDKILGLNLGADDYITKPFNPLELVARVKAQLRRFYNLNENKITNDSIIKNGVLELDTEKWTLKKNNKEIIITPIEYKLLMFLMKSPGRVYTKTQLNEAINGEYYENYENSIMVHISHLREKIEDEPKKPKYIKNVRGVGYKFENQNNKKTW